MRFDSRSLKPFFQQTSDAVPVQITVKRECRIKAEDQIILMLRDLKIMDRCAGNDCLQQFLRFLLPLI